jgi:hypothetical protein
MNFLPELTFSTYPHKLQNLSFNLTVTFFCAPKDYEDIVKANGSRTLWTPCRSRSFSWRKHLKLNFKWSSWGGIRKLHCINNFSIQENSRNCFMLILMPNNCENFL